MGHYLFDQHQDPFDPARTGLSGWHRTDTKSRTIEGEFGPVDIVTAYSWRHHDGWTVRESESGGTQIEGPDSEAIWSGKDNLPHIKTLNILRHHSYTPEPA